MDLILARLPVPGDRNAKAYEIFDGQKLVPIRDYLRAHPGPISSASPSAWTS